MESQVQVWDRFYSSNGRAWRGNCKLPNPLDGKGRALDIGCGAGKSISTLLDMGYDCRGVDFSVEAVNICMERFPETPFGVADVMSLPFDDRSFDYIVSVHVLEHIPDVDMIVAASEIERVLADGGFAFIRDFAPNDMRSENRESSEVNYFHRNPEEIASFFQGMKVVEMGIVEERTRFGGIRRRSEVLLRKLD